MVSPKSCLPIFVALTAGAMLACGDDDPTTPVNPPPPGVDVASVTIVPDRAALEIGDTLRYTATVRDSRQAVIDVAVQWSSSSVSVGTIDAGGLFRAAGKGMAVVTATVTGTTVSATSGLEVVEEGEIIISDDAVVLDSAKWVLLSDSAERARGTYRFRIVAPGGAIRDQDTTRVRVGDVIVGGAGYGFLREVQSVSYDADIATLQTTQGALTDVVLQGDFLHGFRVDDPEGGGAGTLRLGPTVLTPAPGVRLGDVDQAMIPLDGVDFAKAEICYNPTSWPQVCFEVGFEVTDGELRFQPDIDIGAQLGGGRFEEFHLRASGVLNLDAALEFHAVVKAGYNLPDSVKESGKSEKYLKRELFQRSTKFSFFIGPLPVFGRIIFNVSLDGEAKAGIEASWKTGMHIEYGVSGGIQWNGSAWSNSAPPVPRPSYREDPFEFDGVKGLGEIKMSIVPQLNLELYGVAGPFVEVEPYVKAAAEVDVLTGDANAQLLLGADLNVGFKTNDDVKDLTGIGIEYTALGIPLFAERKAMEVFTNNPLDVSVRATATNGDATNLPSRNYGLSLEPADPSSIVTPWWNLFHLDVGCRTDADAPGPRRFGNTVCHPLEQLLGPAAGAIAVFEHLRTGLEHRLEIDKGGARNCEWVGENLTNPFYRKVEDDTIHVKAGPFQRGERKFELSCVAWGRLDVSVTATGDPADYTPGFILYSGDLTTIVEGNSRRSPADPFTRAFYQEELSEGALLGGAITSGQTRSFNAIFSTSAVLEVPTNCRVLPAAGRALPYFDSLYVASEQVATVHFNVACDPLPDLRIMTATTCTVPDQPCFTDPNGYRLELRRPPIPEERGWGNYGNPARNTPAHYTPGHDDRVAMVDQDTVVFPHRYPHERYEVTLDDVASSCRVTTPFLDSDHGNVGRWRGDTRLGTRADGSDASLEIAVLCEGYPPQGVQAVAVSDTSIQVSWNRTDRPEVGGVAGHWVYRDGVLVSPLVPVGREEYPLIDSYIDHGLLPNRSYTYRVEMQASDGRTGAMSGPVSAKTDTAATRPAAPANLLASPQSQTSIRLTWNDRSSNEDYFRLEVSLDAVNWQVAAHPGRNTTSHLHTGLQPGTTYWFRIRAENANATSFYSNISSAMTHPGLMPPAAPTALTGAQQPGTGSIVLGWTDNADDEDEFVIERSPDDGATWTEIARPGPDTESYTDTPPPGIPVYTYRVRACNQAGCSAWSNPVAVVLADDAPGQDIASVAPEARAFPTLRPDLREDAPAWTVRRH